MKEYHVSRCDRAIKIMLFIPSKHKETMKKHTVAHFTKLLITETMDMGELFFAESGFIRLYYSLVSLWNISHVRRHYRTPTPPIQTNIRREHALYTEWWNERRPVPVRVRGWRLSRGCHLARRRHLLTISHIPLIGAHTQLSAALLHSQPRTSHWQAEDHTSSPIRTCLQCWTSVLC